jgi:hypothetical protein
MESETAESAKGNGHKRLAMRIIVLVAIAELVSIPLLFMMRREARTAS